jgi:type II secretory pathway component PulF
MQDKFFYKAIDRYGKKTFGIINSSDEFEAEMILLEQGLNVLSIRAANIFDTLNEKLDKLKEKFTPVTLTDLIVFTRQFATLYSAGIPVLTSLERLKDQTLNQRFRKILEVIIKDVQAGSSLHLAFSKHSKIFPSLYVGMIKVGEEGGVLDIILQRIAAILETQMETQKKIKTATRYPKMVITSIIVAFISLVTFVVPKFTSLFSKFKTELPLPTRILIATNNFFKNYWWLALIMTVAGVLLYKKIRNNEKGKTILDKMALKTPIVGNLLSKVYIARIVRILGLLYKSGISIITGFEIVSAVTDNNIFKNEILKIRNAVSTGTSINVAIRSSDIFPPIVSDLISVGEETGLLDEMLFKIADYFDEESDYLIGSLSSSIEPILLFFVAMMVLLLALGVFMPMWNIDKVYG